MRVRRLSRAVTVAVLAVAALTALGCVGVPRAAPEQVTPGQTPRGEAQPAAAGTRTPRPAESTGPGGSRAAGNDGTDTPEEFRRDMATAQRFAEQYWKAEFAANDDTFRPVRRVIPYTRDGEIDCGGEPIGENNAAYCSAGDFIAYDVNWAYAAFQQVGDAFVYYLLGHEYAHAIQLRLGLRARFTIQQELQADCMAGAYLGDTQRAGRLRVDSGDIAEFRRGLAAVGDEPGQPWFAEGSHGTAEQRTGSFLNGYEQSLEPCDLT